MNFFENRDLWSSRMISNGALDYLKATKTLQTNPIFADYPYYFCAFQSIELSLKAFLRAKGMTKNEMKGKFGHSIRKLYERAKKEGLSDLIELTEEDEGMLLQCGELFTQKVYQYTEVGMKSVITPVKITQIMENLYNAIRPFAEEMNDIHFDKPTAVTE
mgnify:CR=1 FL=1